jgi:hypothetical protein
MRNYQLPITNYKCLAALKIRLSLLTCLFWAGLCPLVAAPNQKDSSPARTFTIGLSPYLDKSVKDDLYRGIVRLLVQDLPLNSTLTIYDAFELKTITQVTVPDARVFDSPKTRANQFAPAIRDLRLFLAQEHAKPTIGHLNFDSALRLPQFLDFLSESLPGSSAMSRSPSEGHTFSGVRPSAAAATSDGLSALDHPAGSKHLDISAAEDGRTPLNLLLIGSPLYQDAKEPAFSMIDGYFPSDGHLQASREKSIFGLTPGPQASRPMIVHWLYFGDPWVSDLHKEKITRFWTLYLERRGDELASLSGDLSTAFQSLARPRTAETASEKRWAIDETQTRVEMLRISRNVEVTDWLTGSASSQMAQTPPARMTGPMKIGIRWKSNIDLDLYATPNPGAETLFFQHVRSPEGYYYKDHRSSPGKEYEFIEFESPVDIRQVEAFVNFYKGYCPEGPQGEVRIEFDGRIYGAPFSIRSEEGNQGRTGRSQQDFWTKIPVQQILKIAPATDRAG